MKLIFALPRWHYDSYHDWRELIRVSNFRTCYYDEVDLSQEAVFVFSPFNGEIEYIRHNNTGRQRRGKLVWMCLERPVKVDLLALGDSTHPVYAITKSGAIPDYIDEVWVGDRGFAMGLQSDKVRFVPVGSHPDLPHQERQPAEFDYISLTYDSPRRQAYYGALPRLRAPNVWPPEREHMLARSRFMLNIHQDDLMIQEPLRFAIAAANKIPMVSETIYDPFPMVPDIHYFSLPALCMASMLDQCLSAANLDKLNGNLHKLLCHDYRFDKNMEGAAKALWEKS